MSWEVAIRRRLPAAASLAAVILVGIGAATTAPQPQAQTRVDRVVTGLLLAADSADREPSVLLLRPQTDEIIAGTSLDITAEARGPVGRIGFEVVQGQVVVGEADVVVPGDGPVRTSIPLTLPPMAGPGRLVVWSMFPDGPRTWAMRTVQLCARCG